MKIKNYLRAGLLSAVMMMAGTSAFAQSQLLNEGFEYPTFPPEGWSVENCKLDGAVNHWERESHSAIAGNFSAHVTSPNYQQKEPVKEEVLITPKIKLDGFYSLDFIWKGATGASIGAKNPEYDFQVRVREVGSSNWTTIFSFLDEQMVKNSGVAFPWPAWQGNASSINLTEWKGKEVEFAFVYCLLKAGPSTGNDLWVDEIKVNPASEVTGPVPTLNMDKYTFPTTFIGGKKYSEPFTIKNTGKDVLTVSKISGLEGTDFGHNLDCSKVSLEVGDTYSFNFTYEPTMAGSPTAKATIETNGGNVNVALSGTKKMLPEGFNYEGFESEIFPPLGWSERGNAWYRSGVGISGDGSAACGFTDKATLRSPRLDLSGDGPYTLQFSYYEEYDGDDEYGVPENFFEVYLSTDGGKNWEKLWLNDKFNTIEAATLDLDGKGSDNCYIMFSNTIPDFSFDDSDYVPEFSYILLDDVVLPNYYGASGEPASSSAVNPKDGAKDVYFKNLALEWTPEQFVTNYKLYLGTSANDFNIINGMDMGTQTQYSIARLDYSTTYYWKVVGYNGNIANSNAPVWSFTVMDEQSIRQYPYEANFDEGFPLGWYPESQNNTKWMTTDFYPFGGTGRTALASGLEPGTMTTLETPEFVIPAEGETLASFYWGNEAPVYLSLDPTGNAVNNTVKPSDKDAIFFDIYVDNEWKNLALLSETGLGEKFWHRESISLTPYAGKPVAFRWRYEVYSSTPFYASLDNFLVENLNENDCKAIFNKESWDAGNVNYDKTVKSRRPILLQNMGYNKLTVKSASFTGTQFTTDLKEGTEIEPNRSVQVYFTYAAGTNPGKVDDNLLVTFDNNQTVSLPVSGTSLASDVYLFDFEDDEHASIKPAEFTTFDMDGMPTVEPVMIYYPKRGTPFAYIVLNCSYDCADWRNVFPVSGEQVLATFADGTHRYETNDWIISPRMEATDQSNFRFYGKCYSTEDSQFKQTKYEVLVSTTDNNPSSFETVVPLTKLDWAGYDEHWTEINVPLSQYAGKQIYVAVRHVADPDSFVSFLDDFWFEHFNGKDSGAMTIVSGNNAECEYYDLNGFRVDKENLQPGIYVKKQGSSVEKVIIR